MKPSHEKLTNDEKIKRIKKRKVLKGFILFFGLLTVFLSIYSLVTKCSPLYAVVSFLIEVILSRYRNQLDPKEEVSDLKNQG